MQTGMTETTSIPTEASTTGKLNAEARAFIPTVPSVSITGYPPPYSFVAPSFGIIPSYAPMPAEKRGLDPNAPEFIPTSAPRPPVVALTQPTKEGVVRPPQFVEKGGFRPQALDKRPPPSPPPRPAAKSYASVAKVVPPPPEPEPTPPPTKEHQPAPEREVPTAPAKPKQRQGVPKNAKQRPKTSKRITPRAPEETQTPAAAKVEAEPVSPTRIAAKGVWGKGNSKSLFQGGSGKILKAGEDDTQPESRPTSKPQPKAEVTATVTKSKPSPVAPALKPVNVKERSVKAPTKVDPKPQVQEATAPAKMDPKPQVQEATAPAKMDPKPQVQEATAPTAAEVATERTTSESPMPTPTPASPKAEVSAETASPSPVPIREEEAPVTIDAPSVSEVPPPSEPAVVGTTESISPIGDIQADTTEEKVHNVLQEIPETSATEVLTAPALGVDPVPVIELEPKAITPGAVGEKRGPLNYADFKAFNQNSRIPHRGVNSVLDAMHSTHKLFSLDADAAAAKRVVAPESAESPEQGCVVKSDRTPNGKLHYAIEDLLAVRSHTTCTKLTSDLRDSPYLQGVLKREGFRANTLDVESLYRNKGGVTSTGTISRATFTMPSALRPGGTSIFESSEHIWSSKGARPLSRETRGPATDDWSRTTAAPVRPVVSPPTNVPPPDLPEDSWQVKQKEQKTDGDRSIKLIRRLRAQLNKMTPATCDQIYDAILDIGIETPEEAEQFVNLIFDKAITNHQYIQMYAQVCVRLRDDLTKHGVFAEDSTDKMNFRRLLLQCCQTAFQLNLEKDFVPPEGADEEETFEALLKHKHKMKGNLMFVALLVQMHLMSYQVVITCISSLIASRKSLQLEALAAFLPGVKNQLMQLSRFKDAMASFVEEIKAIADDPSTENRIQCLLKDVIEDRSNQDESRAAPVRTAASRVATQDGFTVAASSKNRFRK